MKRFETITVGTMNWISMFHIVQEFPELLDFGDSSLWCHPWASASSEGSMITYVKNCKDRDINVVYKGANNS